MQIDEWRKARGWTYSDLGRALSVSPQAARRWCLGERIPRPVELRKIRELTAGQVTADDFVDLPGDALL